MDTGRAANVHKLAGAEGNPARSPTLSSAVWFDSGSCLLRQFSSISNGRKAGPILTLILLTQEILQWTENYQFVVGSKNVVADSLSGSNQVVRRPTEWTLAQEVVDHLVHLWPAIVDLFATALSYGLPN